MFSYFSEASSPGWVIGSSYHWHLVESGSLDYSVTTPSFLAKLALRITGLTPFLPLNFFSSETVAYRDHTRPSSSFSSTATGLLDCFRLIRIANFIWGDSAQANMVLPTQIQVPPSTWRITASPSAPNIAHILALDADYRNAHREKPRAPLRLGRHLSFTPMTPVMEEISMEDSSPTIEINPVEMHIYSSPAGTNSTMLTDPFESFSLHDSAPLPVVSPTQHLFDSLILHTSAGPGAYFDGELADKPNVSQLELTGVSPCLTVEKTHFGSSDLFSEDSFHFDLGKDN